MDESPSKPAPETPSEVAANSAGTGEPTPALHEQGPVDGSASPIPSVPVPPPVPPEKIPEPVPFHFHGNTQEYFRIWIVNTLLTVLTCGVFLAWAKIRKRRYLRGNTTLQGHAFHYTANPWRILIGNMLVAAVFLTYSFFGAVYPVARGAAILIGLALLPWVVVKSLSFNANNTLFRGMRFRFRAGLTEAFWIYLVLPILIPFTLGFYYPAWARRKAAFKMENHRYGDAFFSFSADTGGFFRPMFFGGLIVFGGAMLLGLSVAGYVAISDDTIPNETVLGVLGLVVYGGAFFTGRHFIYPRVFNHIWNHTKLDEHCFMAQMRPGAWMKLQWVNLLAIIFTAGLAVPWATIRNTRYLVSCLHVKLTEVDALEKIDTMGSIQGSALGDSAADFVGVDFGL